MSEPLRTKRQSRLRAAGLHLSLTAMLALVCAALVFLLWYPSPLQSIAGGLELFGLVVGIDLLLGPLLTLLVFDMSKPKRMLVLDLSVIVTLQLAALAYGLLTVCEARPVALAFEGERFRLVTAVAVYEQELPLAPLGLRKLSLTGPRLVRAEITSDQDQKFDAVMMALNGFDLGTRPRYWREWDDRASRSVQHHLRSFDPNKDAACLKAPDFTAALAATGLTLSQLGYLPLLARSEGWIVLLDRARGMPVGYTRFTCQF